MINGGGQQWPMCLKRGLTIVISKPHGSAENVGWIKADEVEELLNKLNIFLVALEDVLRSQRLRAVRLPSEQPSAPSQSSQT